MPTPPAFPPPGTLAAKLTNALVSVNSAVYRVSGGRLGNRFQGAPILLLDHVGRKSGRKRTVPLLYLRVGEDLVIVASRGGSDAMPAWLFNLRANPRTTVQVGREQLEVVARQTGPEERERLWPRLLELYPDWAVYQSRTDRQIPVVVLSPAS